MLGVTCNLHEWPPLPVRWQFAMHDYRNVADMALPQRAVRNAGANSVVVLGGWRTRETSRGRLLALLRPKQTAVHGQALAHVTVDDVRKRRQRMYESPQSTPVATAQLHDSGPSPTERCAMNAEARSMAKPA